MTDQVQDMSMTRQLSRQKMKEKLLALQRMEQERVV
jgi:hypothetical protein